MITVLKSKLFNVKVEDKVLACDGSIGIPKQLMKQANIWEYEKVQVIDVNNGQRFETYAVYAKYLTLYGGASRLVEIGDPLIILTWQICGAPTEPTNPVIVDAMAEYEKPKPMSEYEFVRSM